MINIYRKDIKEIFEEQNILNWAAREVNGMPKLVCPTYLMKKDGTRVDTDTLTEEQILGLIENDIKDFKLPNGSYTSNERELDTFKLLESIKKSWNPSLEAILHFYTIEGEYSHIVSDIIGSIDKENVRGKAYIVAEFLKETNGDYSKISKEDVIEVIKQMQLNEINRKQGSSRK